MKIEVFGGREFFDGPTRMLGHIRVFTEAVLRERFGGRAGFFVHKMPGQWRPGRLPDCFVPVEYGSFFGGFSKA